jgi:hypothetical protein
MAYKSVGFKSIGILLILLFCTLVFSILYPFYSLKQDITEGIGTSLLASDMTNIQGALTTYTTEATLNCQKAVNTINPLISSDPKLSMNVNQSNSSPLPNPCATVDSISNQKPSNSNIIKAINTCYGSNYAAVLNLLDTINNAPTNVALKNDPNFAQIIKTQTDQPVVSGPQSSANLISTYISLGHT